MFKHLLQHRHLILELARREVQDRYVGHVFGWFWAVAQPALFMGIQIVVFTCVFRVSLASYPQLPFDYVTYVLSGLIPWYYTQEMLAKGCNAVSSQANLVKQVVFPVEVLPVKSVLASFFTQVIALTLLAGYLFVTFHTLPLTWLLLPFVMGLQLLLLTGYSFILSAIGVYFRDIRDVVQSLLMTAMYLLPVFYLPDMAPPLFRWLLWLNPFTYMVWVFQDVLYYGGLIHPWAWGIFLLETVIVLSVGWKLFQRLKIMFGSQL